MPSDFDDLFEQLLEHKTVTVALTREGSESVRSSLSRRWNKYKQRMMPLGFLRDDLIGCSLCREVIKSTTPDSPDVAVTIGVRFYLEKHVRKSYEILQIPTGDNK